MEGNWIAACFVDFKSGVECFKASNLSFSSSKSKKITLTRKIPTLHFVLSTNAIRACRT